MATIELPTLEDVRNAVDNGDIRLQGVLDGNPVILEHLFDDNMAFVLDVVTYVSRLVPVMDVSYWFGEEL